MEMTVPKGGRRPGAGRPRKYGRARLSVQTLVHSTQDMRAAWERAARARDVELSDWIREALNLAAGFQQ